MILLRPVNTSWLYWKGIISFSASSVEILLQYGSEPLLCLVSANIFLIWCQWYYHTSFPTDSSQSYSPSRFKFPSKFSRPFLKRLMTKSLWECKHIFQFFFRRNGSDYAFLNLPHNHLISHNGPLLFLFREQSKNF